MLRLCTLALAAATLLSSAALGQDAALATPVRPAALAYDAVAIKPNRSGSGSVSISTRDATLQATNVSPKTLLVTAYGIREGLISGLPGWAESARFDINAKVVDADRKTYSNLTADQRGAVLAAMLEDRFHLKVHIESKLLPVYETVLTKDGQSSKRARRRRPM